MSYAMRRLSLPLGNLLANGVAALVIAVSVVAALRDLACVVVVFGTGIAIVPLLRLKDSALELTLVVLVSVSTLICVAQAVTYVASFSWRPCALILFGITGAGTVAQIVRTLVEDRERA